MYRVKNTFVVVEENEKKHRRSSSLGCARDLSEMADQVLLVPAQGFNAPHTSSEVVAVPVPPFPVTEYYDSPDIGSPIAELPSPSSQRSVLRASAAPWEPSYVASQYAGTGDQSLGQSEAHAWFPPFEGPGIDPLAGVPFWTAPSDPPPAREPPVFDDAVQRANSGGGPQLLSTMPPSPSSPWAGQPRSPQRCPHNFLQNSLPHCPATYSCLERQPGLSPLARHASAPMLRMVPQTEPTPELASEEEPPSRNAVMPMLERLGTLINDSRDVAERRYEAAPERDPQSGAGATAATLGLLLPKPPSHPPRILELVELPTPPPYAATELASPSPGVSSDLDVCTALSPARSTRKLVSAPKLRNTPKLRRPPGTHLRQPRRRDHWISETGPSVDEKDLQRRLA